MIEIQDGTLVCRFSHVHRDAVCEIGFQRTLRIPDDNREHYLPPGLGRFPLEHVDDYAWKLPPAWQTHGGVFLPMYQAEAMWLEFNTEGYPFAVLVAAGKINAVSGETWNGGVLRDDEQNYVVLPEQPWLDGFNVSEGLVRQFVAMPLGQGFTAEEQVTGAAEHGGLQLIVVPMKREVYLDSLGSRHPADGIAMVKDCIASEMGLAPGGLMRQAVEADPHGLDAWDTDAAARCFVHIANSEHYQAITGQPPLQEPVTAADYTAAGLPWFEHYTETPKVRGADALAALDSVAARRVKHGGEPEPPAVSGPTIIINTGKNAHNAGS